jgi:hypothetical protein
LKLRQHRAAGLEVAALERIPASAGLALPYGDRVSALVDCGSDVGAEDAGAIWTGRSQVSEALGRSAAWTVAPPRPSVQTAIALPDRSLARAA